MANQIHTNVRRTKEDLAQWLLGNREISGDECWNWTRSTSPRGYGKIKWGKNGHFRVHRIAAFLWLDVSLDDKRYICHRCDNPRCFNPKHLFAGDSRDNQLDCLAKGRNFQRQKTHCKWGHAFTPENTGYSKLGRRHCRKCHLENEKARYAPRERKPKTHCLRGHEFSSENTRLDKNGERHCRTCDVMRAKGRNRRRV